MQAPAPGSETRDALVVGAGLAGAAAALRLREAGRSVLVLADGDGATAFATGAIEPDERLPGAALHWLASVVPEAVTAAPDGGTWRLATMAGRLVEALAAPAASLDLGRLPFRRVGVLGADVSGAPSLAGLAALLEEAVGGTPRFVPLAVPLAVPDALALHSAGTLRGLLASDAGLARDLAAGVARAVREAEVDAALLPSYVPPATAAAAAAAAEVPTGRLLGTYGTSGAGRELAAALRSAMERAGAGSVAGRVRTLERRGDRWVALAEDGTMLGAGRTAIVATGGAAGGGVRREGRLFAEPAAGRLAWGTALLEQQSAPHGPAADAFLPPRLFDEPAIRSLGIAVDDELRPAGAAPGLMLAGALAVPPDGRATGLAWALASGLRAAALVAKVLDARS
ncbi:MAG: FAD-dependent oxidoreductase [Deltaproteobacteria bacterium]|nr:FAD-dependent oxidoreductase [Deltaproteobacteria bacterium]